ncbi:MAG: hypothetical protein ACOYXB_09730 [Bacteroidota bacterium]
MRILIGLLVAAVGSAVFILLSGLTKETLLDVAYEILKPYFVAAEYLANAVVGLITDGVHITQHKIVFENYLPYYEENRLIIDNWPSYLLYLKWTIFILFSVWVFGRKIKRKLYFTLLLVLTHFFAVFSGLVLIAGIGPYLVDPDSLTELRPHSLGALAMYGLFVLWLNTGWQEVKDVLSDFGVKVRLTERKKNEILWLVLIFILLKSIFVPYFNYYSYIHFLLSATRGLVGLMGYEAQISGPYLHGTFGGSLFMAKWCLGFITMFIFASFVWLTRDRNRTALWYILSGILFLHVVNIVRLAVLFSYVQHHSDTKAISNHHGIYNIVVYSLIFLMWVLWYERFVAGKKKAGL